MTDVIKVPRICYILSCETCFDSFEEAMATAPVDMSAHMENLHRLHSHGTLLMAGAFLDEPTEKLATMAVHATYEGAEEHAKSDPFIQKGMARKWSIRKWVNMFSPLAPEENGMVGQESVI